VISEILLYSCMAAFVTEIVVLAAAMSISSKPSSNFGLVLGDGAADPNSPETSLLCGAGRERHLESYGGARLLWPARPRRRLGRAA